MFFSLRFGNKSRQDETDVVANVTSFPDSLSLTSYKTDARWQQSVRHFYPLLYNVYNIYNIHSHLYFSNYISFTHTAIIISRRRTRNAKIMSHYWFRTFRLLLFFIIPLKMVFMKKTSCVFHICCSGSFFEFRKL